MPELTKSGRIHREHTDCSPMRGRGMLILVLVLELIRVRRRNRLHISRAYPPAETIRASLRLEVPV